MTEAVAKEYRWRHKFEEFIFESLILAQDERWRRA